MQHNPDGYRSCIYNEPVVSLDQREAPKQHRVHDRENGDIQPDGERQGRDCGQGKRAVAPQSKQGKSQIVNDAFQPRQNGSGSW